MKLQSIQALRGLAALLVVFFHIQSLELKGIADNGLTEQAWIGGIFTNGYAGVDLFFVISGFIMAFVTRNTGTGPQPAADFLFARITRIYPLWWAFAAAMTIYMLAAHGLSGQSAGWNSATHGAPFESYLLNSFLLIPQPAFPILNVGWTLVHEVYFYLVFTVFMVLPRRLLPGLLALWAAAILAATFLGYANSYASDWLKLAVHPMTIEFILGALAGYAVTRGWVWRSGVLTLLAVLWLLAALSYQGPETTFTLGWGRVLWYGLPSALLIYGIGGIDTQRRHAWLVPALAGILTTVALFQMTGVDGTSSDGTRRDATLLTVTVGGLAMLAVLWFGWLLGQGAPDLLRRTQPFFRRLLAMAVSLGDWSFSLYLCHLIVLSALRHVFGRLGQIELLAPVFRLGQEGLLDNVTFVIVGVTLSIVAARASYLYFEKPCTVLFGHMRQFMFRRDRAAAAAV